MIQRNFQLVSLFVVSFITSCNTNAKTLQESEKPHDIKDELVEIAQTAEIVLPEKDSNDNWKNFGYYEEWECKGDTIISHSSGAYLESPFGYFEEIHCLDTSMFFKDKIIYQKKVQHKNDTNYFYLGYEFENTKLVFGGPMKISEDEPFSAFIYYADIPDNSVMLDHNIHVGMNKNQLMNKFIPIDSIDCPYKYLVLFNIAGGDYKYIFSFDNDTLSHIKILSSTTYDGSKDFPWYEGLKEDYWGSLSK